MILHMLALLLTMSADLAMSEPSCWEHGVEYHGGGLPNPMVAQVIQIQIQFCRFPALNMRWRTNMRYTTVIQLN